jgi:hypothetical protein
MITASHLKDSLTLAFAAIEFSMEKSVVDSIKVGEEAEIHTGSNGCHAYFCIEESLVRDARDMFPSTYYKWEEALQDALKPLGLFAEPINSCEYALYE